MKRIAVLCVLLPLGSLADGGRELTEREQAELVSKANTLGVGVTVLDSWVQTGDGQSVSGLAVVIYGAREAGEWSCIAPRFEFGGHATTGEILEWEVLPDSLHYLYWPDRASCNGPLLDGYIVLDSLIDTDTLDRLLASREAVLGQVSEKFNGRNGDLIRSASLAGIGIEYGRLSKRFQYRLSYSVSACYSIQAYVRLRDQIEVTEAGEIVC